MAKFRLHWLSGDPEIVEGSDISDAFRRAGYGGGAPNALDYFEPVPTIREALEGTPHEYGGSDSSHTQELLRASEALGISSLDELSGKNAADVRGAQCRYAGNRALTLANAILTEHKFPTLQGWQ